jgi:hypothetical protein
MFYIVAAFVFCIMIYVLTHRVKEYRMAGTAHRFVKVNGTINKVYLYGRGKKKTQLNIDYTYQYEGNHFTGNRIAFRTLFYPETEQFAALNPEHSEVAVYIDPQLPKNSTLLLPKDSRKSTWQVNLMAALVLLAACSILVSVFINQ